MYEFPEVDRGLDPFSKHISVRDTNTLYQWEYTYTWYQLLNRDIYFYYITYIARKEKSG